MLRNEHTHQLGKMQSIHSTHIHQCSYHGVQYKTIRLEIVCIYDTTRLYSNSVKGE